MTTRNLSERAALERLCDEALRPALAKLAKEHLIVTAVVVDTRKISPDGYVRAMTLTTDPVGPHRTSHHLAEALRCLDGKQGYRIAPDGFLDVVFHKPSDV